MTANSDFDKFTSTYRTKFIIVFRRQCGDVGDINFCASSRAYKLADAYTRASINRILTTTEGGYVPAMTKGLLKRATASNRACRVRLSDVKTCTITFSETEHWLASPHLASRACVTVLIIANAFFRWNSSILTVNQRPIRLLR